MYFISRTLVFTGSHKFELNKNLYKLQLQASNLYNLQLYSMEFNLMFQVETLHVHCTLYTCTQFCKKLHL